MYLALSRKTQITHSSRVCNDASEMFSQKSQDFLAKIRASAKEYTKKEALQLSNAPLI